MFDRQSADSTNSQSGRATWASRELAGLKRVLEGIVTFFCTVGLVVFITYTGKHWPVNYMYARYALIAVLGVLYVSYFVIRPFRTGLRSND